jgi:hypothetical protein
MNRIYERVEATGVSISLLLGCVLAHEIGHLVLRTTSHASEGIMRPDFGKEEIAKASQRHLTFTDAERLHFRASQRRTAHRSPGC